MLNLPKQLLGQHESEFLDVKDLSFVKWLKPGINEKSNDVKPGNVIVTRALF